ncbi:MAG TPA: hypothetical protein VEI83_04950, partial [Acidimicrobiales bacterium]|nr:hypothetical protein [Acidimicrobiales bacterium]
NVTAYVPAGASPGSHTVEATCTTYASLPPGPQTYDAEFTVNTPPPPPPPPPPSSSTTTPPSGTTTTTQPHAGGSTTTTTTPGSTTTTTTTTTTTIPAPGTPPSTPGQALRLDRIAIPPGGPVTATGYGCDPSSAVLLTVGSKQVGATTAGASGTFAAPLQVGTLPVGRYQVLAHCGPVLAASLDVVLASQVGQDTATLAIIVFFLLIGLAAFRRRIQLDAAPARARPSEDDEPDEPEV